MIVNGKPSAIQKQKIATAHRYGRNRVDAEEESQTLCDTLFSIFQICNS